MRNTRSGDFRQGLQYISCFFASSQRESRLKQGIPDRRFGIDWFGKGNEEKDLLGV
ncbi:hypothetical protein SCLCIDRAFT_1221327 [Scleroderma citrinum Foug A]|uniref:Uncharacterized protein n=1 Tax=Scleroderma citrinum Foug A TaxID=1036808 RepID=A0A0C2Z038_9AGAM|nr:hypothetical protein SCLCIDRAFT_1221327 [Scleroderma citrinum Foug A]